MEATVILCSTALLATIAAVWIYFTGQSRIRKLIYKIPGPKGLPIVGNIFDFYIDHAELCNLWFKLCGEFRTGIFQAWYFHQPYVILYEAKLVEPILSSPQILDKSDDYRFLVPWLGTGLLISTGDKWRSRRKLLTPAFHFRILEDFVHVFNEQSQILLQQLAKEVGKESFDIFPYIALCALDIICDSAMGRNINAQKNKDSDYVKAVNRIVDIIHNRQLRPWLWPDCLFALTSDGRAHKKSIKTLHDFTEKVIQEKKQQFLKQGLPKSEISTDVFGKKKRLAFLDLLLNASDNGRQLTDEDIREEVDTFMFEGHDTTTVGISWTLYLLGSNIEVQNKVQEELDQIFDDSDRPCTSEDLKEMKYLDCVIKEALRLFPSVPLIARNLKEDIQVGEYLIPAGTIIMILNFMLHRDDTVFPEPESFVPERFLPENAQGRHPYAYVPFSAGPRNCIGQKFALMEEKIVLSTILRTFQVKSLKAREDLQIVAELVLRPRGGLPMKITPRRNLKHQHF